MLMKGERTDGDLTECGKAEREVLDIPERNAFERRLEEAGENWARSFRAISDAVFLVDADHNVLQCNVPFARLVGKNPEEIPGQKCYQLVHGLDEAPGGCVTCAAITAGESVGVELYEPHLDKDIAVSADPTFDAEGDFEFATHIIRDITDRKRQEAAERESRETLQIIFDSMPGLLFFKDRSNTIVRANRALADALDMTPVEIEGRPLSELFPNQSEDYWRDDLEVIESGEPKLGIVEPMQTPGGLRWLQTDKIPYRDSDGEVVGIIGFSVDITERREAEENFRIAQFEADQAGDLIARVGSDGRLLYANDSALRLYGYEREEMLALHVWDIDKNVSEEGWEEIWRSRKESGLTQIEAAGVHKDGSTIPLEMTLSFLEFEGQKFIVVFGRDVPERKTAEAELMRAEKKYRELAESLPQVVFELDHNGFVTYVNNNALDVFGYTEEDIENGLNALDIIEEVDRERVSGAIDKMFDGRSTGAIREYLAKRKDGTTFPAMVFSSLVTDDAGGPLQIRGILTDITERMEIERALRESEEKYRELADTLPEIVFELDYNGVFTYLNEGAAERLGYERDEILGKLTPLDTILPDEHQKAWEMFEQMREGLVAPVEFTIRRKNGSTFPALIYSSLVIREGTTSGQRGILIDISERKRVEDELQKVNVELEGFAHTVSHDLRGPLTVMTFAAEMISRSLEAPQTKEVKEALHEATRMLEKNIGRTHTLIDDLLALAEAGQRPSDASIVEVSATVRSILDENKGLLLEKGFEVKVDEDLGSINANPTHVYQVFSNLVRNAVIHGGGTRPMLEIRHLGGVPEGGHRYLVRDNGPGIPADALRQIFVPFFKGEDGGTGIGLATVAKVVQLYGGDIRAYNDSGACFEFVMHDWVSADMDDQGIR